MTQHRAWSRHRDGLTRMVNARFAVETELPLLDAICVQDGISRSEMVRRLVLAESARRSPERMVEVA